MSVIGQDGHDQHSRLSSADMKLAYGPWQCEQAVVLEQLAYNREMEIIELRREVKRLRFKHEPERPLNA